MNNRPALGDLITLAIDAGREIMAVRDVGFERIDKSDGSPVTIADQRAEAIIEAGLAKFSPGVPVIGEEAFAAGRIPEPGARFYCVDPLDGTRDFIAGRDEFTVNIALIENRAPVMGVVFAPATGELYAGEPGRAIRATFDGRSGAQQGAYAAIQTSAEKPAGGWRAIASRHSGANAETEAFLAKLGEVSRISASSSIKLCRLAEGAGDLYPRFGNVNEWDIAAGHALLSAAGGGLMTLRAAPLHYGGNAGSFLVPGFIAFANAAAASAARNAL